jgi:hypothetical protein
MIEPDAPRQTRPREALLAIGVGGLIAGALDLLQACIQLGWNTPLLIAGGLLGSMAEHGGVGAHILGILLPFFIALSAAAVYYAASRRLPFMKQYPLLCGLYFAGHSDAAYHPAALRPPRHGTFPHSRLPVGTCSKDDRCRSADRLQRPLLHEVDINGGFQ